MHHKTSNELENSIKDRIKRLLNSDIVDVTPLDDLDAQLGITEITETVETPEETDGN